MGWLPVGGQGSSPNFRFLTARLAGTRPFPTSMAEWSCSDSGRQSTPAIMPACGQKLTQSRPAFFLAPSYFPLSPKTLSSLTVYDPRLMIRSR